MIYLVPLWLASAIAVWCYTFATYEPISEPPSSMDKALRIIESNVCLIAYNVGALIVFITVAVFG